MAEGHAVHGMAKRLNQLSGQVVLSISPREYPAERFDRHVLASAEAHGKNLLIHFSGLHESIHLHLGMVGRVSVRKHARALTQERLPRTLPPEPPGLAWRFACWTHIADVTRPMVCEVLDPVGVESLHRRLGPDPLRFDAVPEEFYRKVLASQRAIGVLILDQSTIAGIGNVYRSEILFRLRINPFTIGRLLSIELLEEIWRESCYLLSVGLEAGWIVTDPSQLQAAQERLISNERVPRWSKRYAVYARAGQPCTVCGATVQSERLGLQTAFWCPRCQPEPCT